ncbi:MULTISPECIES: restriction endonuclease subunit S [Gammaproteobacteria]|uniref:restriction endonuclease subunit S n=1 Tax=Gammaproteobacteria TaxID=1236 RepID=UPI001AEA35CB|nr:restriction endonuclease subunit S [Vibrio cholerae]MBP0923858.1 restriction endonuclease subunit S [Vibrio cholerae]MDY7587433.1 restriction endonuclease subunit S [Vibrio cholerae]
MKQQAYPEYKESGVQWLGQVPKHWEIKRGRFIMRVNPPAPLLRSLKEDQEVSFVPMDAVNELGGIRLEQTRIKAEVSGGYTEFQDGDVVIAKITPCFENGKGSIATGLVNSAAYGTTELHVLRASQALDYRFLFYLTITDGYRKLGESEMYGAGGQKRVPPDFCKDFLTPLPPLPEQVAIADFLNRETGRLDTLMAKKRQLIALLKEKRTALISRIVTRGLPTDAAHEFGLKPHTRFKNSGIEWLGQVPEGWEALPLRRLIKFVKTGNTPSGAEEYHFEEGGFNWYSPSDVSDAVYLGAANRTLSAEGKAEVRIFPKMTVMLVGIGATIGKVGLASNESSCNQQINAIICNRKLYPVFATYYLKTMRDFIVKCGKFTTMPIINQDETKNLIVTVPTLPEQTAIATYLGRETDKIDRLVVKVEAAINRLQEYRAALITAAVTGKIDVRKAVV